MIKDNCIFCKLANGIFPTATVYEDEDFRAILDIEPAAFGHVLLIPKNHMADLFELDSEIGSKAFLVAQHIAKAMKEALNCDGINLLQNSGTAAWQSVFHLHIHLIPRYKDDAITVPWKKYSYAEGEAKKYADKIASFL